MRNRSNMRPQDILILLKIVALEEKEWKQLDLANYLKISPSEVAESLVRSKFAMLIDAQKKKPLKSNLLEFLIYGLKYVFPVSPGSETRGVPTAHSSPFMNKKIISNHAYVWPYSEGKVRGSSIEPLFKSIPKIVETDEKLYEFLAYVDAIRVGRAREQKIAKDMLSRMIKG